MRRTKIVATVGPATDSRQRICEMIESGMNVARLNFSHGSHDDHTRYAGYVREEAQRLGKPVALLQDLQGPKIRTGQLEGDEPVTLEEGQRFTITTESIMGNSERVSCGYPYLPQDVTRGDRILVSDGLIELRVLETTRSTVVTEVVHGGDLRPRQGVNLPGVRISWPSVTSKDLEDLEFGLELGVDYVAISFVRQAADVMQVKQAIEKAGKNVPVIAKLEKPEAVDALDEIISVSDGVMVARGDMGVEMAPERVPVIQKEIIRAANRADIPVITATQMLDSMISAPQPTRAEVSDVANAVLDGSDAIMLSGETAIGDYPIRAVRMMVRIAEAVEDVAIAEHQELLHYLFDELRSVPQGVAAAVSALTRTLPLTVVCVLTQSGTTARLVSHYRPRLPILGFTPLQSTYQRLSLLWGVMPIKTEFADTEEEYYHQVESVLLEQGFAQSGDNVVITGGHPITKRGPTNFVKVLTLE